MSPKHARERWPIGARVRVITRHGWVHGTIAAHVGKTGRRAAVNVRVSTLDGDIEVSHQSDIKHGVPS